MGVGPCSLSPCAGPCAIILHPKVAAVSEAEKHSTSCLLWTRRQRRFLCFAKLPKFNHEPLEAEACHNGDSPSRESLLHIVQWLRSYALAELNCQCTVQPRHSVALSRMEQVHACSGIGESSVCL